MQLGLRLRQKTLEFISCIAGSSASQSTRVRGCIGMLLSKVDGEPVGTQEQVVRATKGRPLVRLHFLNADAAFGAGALDEHARQDTEQDEGTQTSLFERQQDTSKAVTDELEAGEKKLRGVLRSLFLEHYALVLRHAGIVTYDDLACISSPKDRCTLQTQSGTIQTQSVRVDEPSICQA